jgi:DNA topoisomerase-3
MPGILYIAEKEKVAARLAEYLSNGKAVKRDGYYEAPNGDKFSFAQGHLLSSESFDKLLIDAGAAKNSKGGVSWSNASTVAVLPLIPKKYNVVPDGSTMKSRQLGRVCQLVKEADGLCHVGDMDREGQAIVDNILIYAGVLGKKPVKRLSFAALDDESIRRAIAVMSDNADDYHRRAYYAAEARRRADYLFGMNLTMAATIRHSNFEMGVISLGRVQSPTLFILVKRFLANKNFKPVNFYVPQVEVDGVMFSFDGKNTPDAPAGAIDEMGRILDRAYAQSLVDKINQGAKGTVTAFSKKKRKQGPPLPYSLPEIQTDMGKKYGFPVLKTQDACQSLYLNEMQSYVGTDCRYLPLSMKNDASNIIKNLQTKYPNHLADIDIDRTSECWSDEKMKNGGKDAAHHAIIPTGIVKPLSNEVEKVVYDEVCRRYLMQFMPEHQYLAIAASVDFEGASFSCSEKQTLVAGWKTLDSVTETDEVEVEVNSDNFNPKSRMQ